MKKLIILCFLFFVIGATAQVDNYFANNPQWRISWMFAPSYPCVESWDYVYYLAGDSIMADKTYHILNRRGMKKDEYFAPPIPGYCDDSYVFNGYYGMVRQAAKKIFYYTFGQEELLYDFDLEVGDQLPETYNVWSNDIYVTAIDSMLIGDSYRKVFTLSEGYLSNLLIEGVGFGEGFLEYYPDWEFPAELICFALNDVVYYPAPGTPCDLSVEIDEPKIESTTFEILPNPSTGLFTLALSGTEKQFFQLSLRDINGRLISQENWVIDIGTNVKSLNLAELNKGVYFLMVSDEQGRYFQNEKIILY